MEYSAAKKHKQLRCVLSPITPAPIRLWSKVIGDLAEGPEVIIATFVKIQMSIFPIFY